MCMMLDFWVNLIETQSNLTLLLWLSVLIIVMYVMRQPMHQLAIIVMRSFRHMLRLIVHGLKLAEKKLILRNRNVLLKQGRERSERNIEREFQQVEMLIHRDLSSYPLLQRDLKEQITRIDKDYVNSHEVSPLPPEWLKAVEAVANIPDNGSLVVAKILNDIHSTLKKAMNKEANEHHRANRQRHTLLKKMKPYWRSLTNTLNSVEKKIIGLEQRSIIIDSQMRTYEGIRKNTDDAESILSESSLTQFFISGLALCLGVLGLTINFHLITLPLEEMVGASSYLGSSLIRASEATALFMVSIEVILGMFVMEAANVTRLFPVIHLLGYRRRKIIFYILLGFLFIFASVEASLTYMNDILITDRASLTLLLTGVEVTEPPLHWIPTMGQAVMAFVLPFLMIFLAIPLELFVLSLRTMIGGVLVWLLRIFIIFIQLVISVFLGVERLMINFYDLVIFIPLAIEAKINTLIQAEIVKKYQLETHAKMQISQVNNNSNIIHEITTQQEQHAKNL